MLVRSDSSQHSKHHDSRHSSSSDSNTNMKQGYWSQRQSRLHQQTLPRRCTNVSEMHISSYNIHLCLLLGLTPCFMSASTATLSALAAAAHTLSLSGSCLNTPSNPLLLYGASCSIKRTEAYRLHAVSVCVICAVL
jgi:hypothetical protein